MIDRGNRSIRRKPAPVSLCPPQTPHACPAANPGRRGGKPTTNRLSYGTAQSLVLLVAGRELEEGALRWAVSKEKYHPAMLVTTRNCSYHWRMETRIVQHHQAARWCPKCCTYTSWPPRLISSDSKRGFCPTFNADYESRGSLYHPWYGLQGHRMLYLSQRILDSFHFYSKSDKPGKAIMRRLPLNISTKGIAVYCRSWAFVSLT
jgi:hypothetical protein